MTLHEVTRSTDPPCYYPPEPETPRRCTWCAHPITVFHETFHDALTGNEFHLDCVQEARETYDTP